MVSHRMRWLDRVSGGVKSKLPKPEWKAPPLEVLDRESCFRDKLRRIARQVTSSGEPTPQSVKPVLQPAQQLRLRATMLDEQQMTAGFQDAADLGQSSLWIRYGA